MKFAILAFLGLCAVVAAYEVEYDFEIDIEPQNKVIDSIKAKIEELLKRATDDFSIVADKAKGIIGKLNDAAADLVLKAKGKANSIKDEIEGKLDDMKKKGGEVAACAKRLEPDYWQVERDAMADVKVCAGDVYVAANDMQDQVGRGMSLISSKIREFRDMVGDCLGWNPISATKCVYDKFDDLKKIMGGIMEAAKDALSAAQHKSVEIMNEAHQCNAKALSKASMRIKELNQKLANCYNADILLY
uniref:Venom polypeptide n=1 Tax=Dolopus genitalis TaxID=2488630 RepID=A0A3G5BIE9_DOLGE|nr:venom polypeptide [Dolopus genitalis]